MNFITGLNDKNKLYRRLILAAIMVLTFLFQNTGGLFPAPFGIHAMLLVPLTVCIAMFEREFAGLFFGLFAGAMLDAFNPESLCFSSIVLTCFGFAAGALITYLMRNNLVCALILTAVSAVLYNSLYFLLHVAFNGTENPLFTYFRYYFTSTVYTVLLTPIYYFIVRAVAKGFKSAQRSQDY